MDISQLKVLTESDINLLDGFLADYVDDLNYFKTFYLYKTYGELLVDVIDSGLEVFDEDVTELQKDENFESNTQCHIFIKGEEVEPEKLISINEPIST